MSGRSGTPLLEARGIVKRYGSVEAVAHADFRLDAGEIVALVGDNGAGKSSLIKVMAGATRADGGTLLLEGGPVHFHGPLDARRRGIETVYQDLAVLDNLDVTANLFLGRELLRRRPFRWLALLSHRRMTSEAAQVLKRFRVTGIPVDERLSNLSGGQRQIVAICRAAAWGSRVVILDEPTASLGVQESNRVLEFMENLRQEGIGVAWVSHNLQQVFAVADRAVVMRRGYSVADIEIRHSSLEEVVKHIVGAGMQEGFVVSASPNAEPVSRQRGGGQ